MHLRLRRPGRFGDATEPASGGGELIVEDLMVLQDGRPGMPRMMNQPSSGDNPHHAR
jgi:hypothetical protein